MYLVIENFGILGFATFGRFEKLSDARACQRKYPGSVVVKEENTWVTL